MSNGYDCGKRRVYALIFYFSLLTLLLPAGSKVLGQAAAHEAELLFQYPQASEEMRQYLTLKYIAVVAGHVFSASCFFALLQCGVVAAFRNACSRMKNYPAEIAAMAAFIYLLVSLFQFPFDFYLSYFLQKQFCLSAETFGNWLRDQFMGYLLGFYVAPVFSLAFLLIRRFERGWFLPVWLLTVAASIAVSFLGPLASEPVFNKFRSLQECRLKQDIQSLCRLSGINNAVVLVADKSRQTNKINAYVSGLSSSKRIVLFDNLVNDVPEEQVLAVVAHELGHYRLRHTDVCLGALALCLLPLFFIAEYSVNRFLLKLPSCWQIKSRYDPAMLAVLSMLLSIAPLIYSPFSAGFARMLESEADAYALRLTKNPLGSARLFSLLSRINLSDPDPPAIIEFWFFTHPSLKHRIDRALKSSPGS